MHIKYAVVELMKELQRVLEGLSDQQYTMPVGLLSGATVGQHVRHIVEFFVELNKGYDSGEVNYDRRSRDHATESNRLIAIRQLVNIGYSVTRPEKPLSLVTYLVSDAEEPIVVATNYSRELIYNIEHTIHHMALLRIAITAISSLHLPDGFGVAASTVKNRAACAQ
jgi:hypothetical protein